jgi:hypothetical protein
MAGRRYIGPGAGLETQCFSHDQGFGGSFKDDDVVGPIVSVKRCLSPRLDGEMSDHVVFPNLPGPKTILFSTPGRDGIFRGPRFLIEPPNTVLPLFMSPSGDTSCPKKFLLSC